MTLVTKPYLASIADADAIATLVDGAYGHYIERIGRKPYPMTVDYTLAIQEHQLWLLTTGSTLTAVLELIPHDTYMLIENIAVAPNQQGQGLGRFLMLFAEEQAQQQGLKVTKLYTNEHFTENIDFYSRLGYVETTREAYQGSDVLYMTKVLSE